MLDERDEWIELRKHRLRTRIDESFESLQRGEGVDGHEVLHNWTVRKRSCCGKDCPHEEFSVFPACD